MPKKDPKAWAKFMNTIKIALDVNNLTNEVILQAVIKELQHKIKMLNLSLEYKDEKIKALNGQSN